METMDLTPVTTDRLEQALLEGEATVARVRATQLHILTELDQRQVPLSDGSRTLTEWAASRMDLAPDTAQRLVQTAHRLADQPHLATELAEGSVSFDRVVEESRLVCSGADQELVARSRGWDIAGLRRMVARHQRITRRDEQRIFRDRQVNLQPTLDQTYYKLWGGLPGLEGRLFEQALLKRADQFPPLPDRKRSPRSQQFADALVAIAQDSLDGTQTEGASPTPVVSVFMDAQLAARTNGEAGAEIDVGLRVGPLTLEQIIYDGTVEILKTTPNGTPLTVGPTSRTIPPKVRRYILHRDGGACTADGCQSRYRLQPHHITPRSQGGSHHPDNLTTLCCRLSFLRRCISIRQGRRKDIRAFTTMWLSTATATGSTPTVHPNDDAPTHPTHAAHPDRTIARFTTASRNPGLRAHRPIASFRARRCLVRFRSRAD